MKKKIMKRLLLLLTLLMPTFSLFAQAPIVAWEKSFGSGNDEEAFYAAPSPDGGIIVCGYTMSEGQGKKDIWVMKLSENGEKLWDYTYGGPGDDIAYCFTFGKFGEIILAGTTDSWGKGKLDGLIMAIDQRGRELWKQTYGGPDNDILKRIFPLTDSTWISFGETNSWGSGKTDILLLQTDSTAKLIRKKALGGKKAEKFGDVYLMPDTTYTIIGSTRSFTNGVFDVWFIRVDSFGRTKGKKNFGRLRFEYGNGIIPTPDEGYIIAGASNTESQGLFDGWALKINRDLFEEWVMQTGQKKDEHYINVFSHKRAYMLAGNTQSYGSGGWDMWLTGLGAKGEILWNEQIGNEGHDFINFIMQTENGYSACGYTTSSSAGGKDFWVVKLKQ
jgi:hypothetical protein